MVEQVGLRRVWRSGLLLTQDNSPGDDVTAELAGPSTGAAVPDHAIQRIIRGDAVDEITRAGQRNRDERRIVMILAGLIRA